VALSFSRDLLTQISCDCWALILVRSPVCHHPFLKLILAPLSSWCKQEPWRCNCDFNAPCTWSARMISETPLYTRVRTTWLVRVRVSTLVWLRVYAWTQAAAGTCAHLTCYSVWVQFSLQAQECLPLQNVPHRQPDAIPMILQIPTLDHTTSLYAGIHLFAPSLLMWSLLDRGCSSTLTFWNSTVEIFCREFSDFGAKPSYIFTKKSTRLRFSVSWLVSSELCRYHKPEGATPCGTRMVYGTIRIWYLVGFLWYHKS